MADQEWAAWDETLSSVVRLMGDGDLMHALREIDQFLQTVTDAGLRCSVRGMRAQLKQDLGDFDGSKSDLVTAVVMGTADFTRYVNQLALAEIRILQGAYSDAIEWHSGALLTSIEGGFSGGAALRKLLTLQPEHSLSDEDRKLCNSAVRTSWRSLELVGEPDPSDLPSAISIIIERESGGRVC